MQAQKQMFKITWLMKVPSPRTSPQRPKNPKDYHHKTLNFNFKPLGTRRPRIRSTRALVFGSWKAGERASHEVPLVCRSRACVRIRARKLRRRDHFLGVSDTQDFNLQSSRVTSLGRVRLHRRLRSGFIHNSKGCTQTILDTIY